MSALSLTIARSTARSCVVVWLLLSSIASGCQSLSYEPNATVGMSPEKIPLTVEVRTLKDVSPIEDRKRWLLGTAATAPGTLTGDLAEDVTKALIENLYFEGVFKDVKRKPKEPDIVLSGTLRRFYGKANLNTLGVITSLYAPLWLLGIPIYTSYGTVDLELTFDRPDGRRIAEYKSTVDFSELSSYWGNAELEIGTRLNRSFSEAVRDLREKMLKDKDLLVESGAPSASPGAESTLGSPAEKAAMDPGRSAKSPTQN